MEGLTTRSLTGPSMAHSAYDDVVLRGTTSSTAVTGPQSSPICDDHERMELVVSFLSDTHGQEEFGEDLGGWLSDAFRNDVEEAMLRASLQPSLRKQDTDGV